MTSLACWSKLQQKTTATQTNPAHLLDHVYSSKPPQAQAHRQWWGPQQQSWNPSMNWSNLITSTTRWHHQQDWSWHLHPHRSLLEEPLWVWYASRVRQTRGSSNLSKKRSNPLPSLQHRLWTLPAQVFQPFRFPTLLSVKTWVRKIWIVSLIWTRFSKRIWNTMIQFRPDTWWLPWNQPRFPTPLRLEAATLFQRTLWPFPQLQDCKAENANLATAITLNSTSSIQCHQGIRDWGLMKFLISVPSLIQTTVVTWVMLHHPEVTRHPFWGKTVGKNHLQNSFHLWCKRVR